MTDLATTGSGATTPGATTPGADRAAGADSL